MLAEVRFTNYVVEDNAVVERPRMIEVELNVAMRGGERWLMVGAGPQSMPWVRVPEAIERGGWYAQAGTRPVYVAPCPSYSGRRPYSAGCGCGPYDVGGGWGGRSYPEIFVGADVLERALLELP